MDFARWVLPLSGGYDSRGILCLLLKNNDTSKENLKTVTWGSNSTQSVKGSEGYIADKLSKKLDISNKYYNIDFSGERIDKVLDRFIRFGEGRVDHFSAYTDGFKMWQDLYDAGIEGIIRGDMAFGGPNINSALSIRYALEYSVCSDFSNLKNYKNYGFAKQVLPEYLEQKKHESLDKWHARVYLQYRMPIVQSALADLKLSYVEQINPLLSKELFKFGRVSLPDHLWVDKKLWKKVVDSLSPKVNIAKIDSIPSINDIFKNEDFISVIKKELNSEMAKNLLPKEFLKFVLKGIEKNNKKVIFNTKPLIRIIKGLIPQALKEAILDNIKKPNVNSNKLAFRTFIIIRTNKILHEDSLIIN